MCIYIYNILELILDTVLVCGSFSDFVPNVNSYFGLLGLKIVPDVCDVHPFPDPIPYRIILVV